MVARLHVEYPDVHELRKAKELANIQDNAWYQDAQDNVSAGTKN